MNFIYDIFSYLMKGCLYISGNHYILALLFFALAMEIVLLPLSIKQQKSQIKMAKVKPKEMAIREKYKGRNDRATQQKMTMEIQEMYQQNGYNQFGGCLPLLIQLPIIFILFAIVRQPISYASNITKEDADFIKNNASAAVEYYQAEKEALIKDGFTTEEYNEYIKLIESYQVELGGKKIDETTESGLNIYEFNDGANLSQAEIALSNVIINGKSEVEYLVENKRIDESFTAVFDEYGFEEYADRLPEYRIAGVSLLNEPDFNRNIWLMIIPLLVFLTSFFSTKITRKFSGSANQTDANGNPIGGGLFMEVGMPLMSAFFAYSFSAAIGAYWVWRTLLAMIKTVLLAKAMPIPEVTAEEIAAAKKEMKTNTKKKKVITIEVDEDDNSYDGMIVQGTKTKTIDPTTRTPRHIEMLTADDENDTQSEESSEN